jgi:hypothetical protein
MSGADRESRARASQNAGHPGFVSGYVRQQVSHLNLPPPQSYAMHAHLMPSCYLERVASTRPMTEGAPLRALAERLRTPLCEPGGALHELSSAEQNQLKMEAAKLAEVFQRSSSNVEGRNGYLSLRNHQLRGLTFPSRVQMGRPQRSGFSGRSLGRCLPRSWHQSRSPLLLSVRRGKQ